MLDGLAELEFCYLTTTGRRTGRPHTIEIWFGLHAGRLYLLAGGGERSDWVRNIQAQPEVSLRIGDVEVPGTARVLTSGTQEDDLARTLLVTKYEPIEGSSLASWGRTALAVAIDPRP